MFNLRRMVTMTVVTTLAVTSMSVAGIAAPPEPAKPKYVTTITLMDSAGRYLSFDGSKINTIGTLTMGTVNNTNAVSCDSWLEVHFTVTFLGELLLRWVHRVRSCVDGINVTSLAERLQYVNTRAPSIQVGSVLGDSVSAIPATVVSSYYQREFKYCSLDPLPCLYTWQPGNFIYAVRNGQMLWQPSPFS